MNAVHLKNLQFRAFHGVYTGEEKVGGNFEVNLSVWYKTDDPITRLEQTINYVVLFEIVNKEMNKRRELIETVAESICQAIHQQYPVILEIRIEIWKLTPPIEAFQGATGISLHKTY